MRDGWLIVVQRTVGMWLVLELESQDMPRRWRLRQAQKQRPRMTPELDPVTMELPSLETVMRLHRVNRSQAYRLLQGMRSELLGTNR